MAVVLYWAIRSGEAIGTNDAPSGLPSLESEYLGAQSVPSGRIRRSDLRFGAATDISV
jgi:hypothetical protein